MIIIETDLLKNKVNALMRAARAEGGLSWGIVLLLNPVDQQQLLMLV